MTEKKDQKNETPSIVTLVEDPFADKSLEISEAQASDEELILDEPLEPLDPVDPALDLEGGLKELESLTQALAEEAKNESEYTVAEESEEEAAKRLAAEIAEDQALAAELAKQDEEEIDEELAAALPKEPVADETGAYDLAELESCIEAILFMSDKPMSVKRIQELLGPDFKKELFEQAIAQLTARFQEPRYGVELVNVANGYQFRTKAGRAALAKKLAKIQTQRLSSGGMECLAIIAYRQPVMKEELDQIRGVDCSYFIRGLLDKKLIRISGRSELPGRPMLYSTTDEFLEIFGLADLSALPPLRELEQMVPASESASDKDEDPRVKELRRLVGQMNNDHSTTLNYDPREDEKILKDIRERVQSIPTSTPYLDEQKALEKAAQLAQLQAFGEENGPAQPTLEQAAQAEAAKAELATMPPQAENVETSTPPVSES